MNLKELADLSYEAVKEIRGGRSTPCEESNDKFKCVVCGEEMPTRTEKVIVEGGKDRSDYEDYVTRINLSKDVYQSIFVEYEKFCEWYNADLDKILEQEKISLQQEIDEQVTNQEFKQIVLKQKTKKLEYLCNSIKRDFKDTINGLSSVVHRNCMNVFDISKRDIKEEKILINRGKKKVLIASFGISIKEYLEKIPRIGQYFKYFEPSDEEMRIEF